MNRTVGQRIVSHPALRWPPWGVPKTCAVFILAFAAQCADGIAAEADGMAAEVDERRSSGPYCGIYCLAGAMAALGRDADLEELVSAKYIGSDRGSSADELVRAARERGVTALPLVGLSSDSLRRSQCPIILHVAASRHARVFNHWVLFLGVEDGLARICDPPNAVELWTFADLLSLWDGGGVAITDNPELIERFLVVERLRPFTLILVAVVFLAILARVLAIAIRATRFVPDGVGGLLKLPTSQSFALIGISALAAIIYHLSSADGFIRNQSVIRAIGAIHGAATYSVLSTDDVASRLRAGDAIIIDARFAADFRHGHIPGAVNIPIDWSVAQRRRAMAHIPPNAAVIIYCQSKGCAFADDTAREFTADGFDNVGVYRGGWVEWDRTTKNSDE